jgi:glycosyltransferase involved in cell wall biosynthesis
MILYLCFVYLRIKKINPNCIHSLLWSANVLGCLIAKILKIPIVCALHLATNNETKGTNTMFRNIIDSVIFKLPTKVIAVSNSMIKDIYKNNKNLIALNKLQVITNSIDVNYVHELARKTNFTKELLAIEQDCFVIGSVGRFIERKNHKLLIEAFALFCNQYINTKLILIGYGPLEMFLKDFCMKLGIKDKVLFIEDQAYKYYQIFDCFVLTSHNESFGLVTLEAMSFGLPCIVATENNQHDIITNGINGILINTNRANILSGKIKEVYLNYNVYKKTIGKNAQLCVQQGFNSKVMSKKYCQVFEQISYEN